MSTILDYAAALNQVSNHYGELYLNSATLIRLIRTTSYLIVRRVNCPFKMYLEKSSEIALDKVKCHGSLSKSKYANMQL